LKIALNDLLESLKKWRLWLYLGWADIKIRYRRSAIGPWWITISMGVFILAMGAVYSRILHQDVKSYMPFLTGGFLIWIFISTSINEAPDVFNSSKNFISQIKLPFFIYIFRLTVRNSIILAHNFLIYFLVIIFFRINPGWGLALVLPGFILIALNVTWLTLFLGVCGSRFRDLNPIVISLVTITFFISPITWGAKMLGTNSIILKLNPITYFLEVFRDPILGITPPASAWLIMLSMVVIGYSISLFLFSCFYHRIAFWVE